MLTPGNVATPATAATVVVPERVPLPGFAPSATVTLSVRPVAVFSCRSSAVAFIAGVLAAPATVLLGWTLKLSCVAAPAVMLNGVEVVPLRLPLLAVSVRSEESRVGKGRRYVGTPAAGVTEVGPVRVPVPGFGPGVTVTV